MAIEGTAPTAADVALGRTPLPPRVAAAPELRHDQGRQWCPLGLTLAIGDRSGQLAPARDDTQELQLLLHAVVTTVSCADVSECCI